MKKSLLISVLMLLLYIPGNAFGAPIILGPDYFDANKSGLENLQSLDSLSGNVLKQTTGAAAGLSWASKLDYTRIGYINNSSVNGYTVEVEVNAYVEAGRDGDWGDTRNILNQDFTWNGSTRTFSFSEETIRLDNAWVKFETITPTAHGSKGEWEKTDLRAWLANTIIWEVTSDFTYQANNPNGPYSIDPLLIKAGSYIVMFEAVHNGASYVSYLVFNLETPAPAALWLLGTGVIGVASLRRKYK